MANSRTFLINAATRHSVFIQRFANRAARDIVPYLDQAKQAVIDKIKSVNLERLTKKQRDDLYKSLNSELDVIYKSAAREIRNNALSLAEYEAGFSTRMLRRASSASVVETPVRAVKAAIISSPLLLEGDKITLDSALRKLSVSKRRELVNIVRDGINNARDSVAITNAIEKTTTRLQRRQVGALVRTITNQVSTEARQAITKENSDIVDGVEWVSTLDGSTTVVCQARDGQIYPVGSGPRPPAHWGCRSTVIPAVKEEYRVLGLRDQERPAVGDDGPETVTGRTDYGSWLKRQSAEFQNEALGGKEKGKLFRQGGLKLDAFINDKGQSLTLAQLKRRESLAFKKAGLD